MAAAAELVKQQTNTFDWEIAEAQFAQPQPERPPESEIYGRSLSSPYRLGVFAVGKTLSEVARSPEADQGRDEFYTSVEEGFGTDAELGGGLEVRDFDKRPVINGQAMAKDLKTAVSDMTAAGLTCAIETAKKDKRFRPQLTRSGWDHKNALTVNRMVRGETDYNTRIVVTPLPEEAIEESGAVYWRGVGYVPHLRRGFVQLYHANGEELITGSLSFDGSDKKRLRELFSKYGVDIPEEETTDNWLQYAITGTMSEEEAKEFALEIANQAGDPEYKKTTNTVEVTNEHRAIMETVFNESYIHACESLAVGRQTKSLTELMSQLANNAQYFNEDYKQALYRMEVNQDKFSDEDFIVIHELLVYSTIEMMRALHLQAAEQVIKSDSFRNAGYLNIAYLKSLDQASFQDALGSFGAEGARNNRTYSACGLAISPGGKSNPDESPQHAFGGNCPEVKNGQITKCPHCKKIVRAIVPNKEKIYCSNAKCKLAAPGLAGKK